jgi:hypothetical protein
MCIVVPHETDLWCPRIVLVKIGSCGGYIRQGEAHSPLVPLHNAAQVKEREKHQPSYPLLA